MPNGSGIMIGGLSRILSDLILSAFVGADPQNIYSFEWR